MKRALWIAGLIAVVAAPDLAWSQLGGEIQEEKYIRLPHRFQILVEGGMGLPAEPGLFNDYWNSAFQFGVGAGMVILPWLEINGTYTSLSFSNNALESKGKIGYTGVEAVEEGSIHTTIIYGSARFIGVPKSRTNPFVEFGLGYFSTKADDLVIEGEEETDPEVLRNTMESVSGLSVIPAVGVQYSMNERWTAYTRYTYIMNLNEDFAPGDLLLPVGATEPTKGGNQVISSIAVGIMMTF
jgi:hypothetical protein